MVLCSVDHYVLSFFSLFYLLICITLSSKQSDTCEAALQRNVTSSNPCFPPVQWQWWEQGGFDSSKEDGHQEQFSNESYVEWMSQAPVFVLVVAPSHRTGSSYLGEKESQE